eukprot:CAMPEP_0170490562 /NCGR_PEP_ID=MMETSP0208-20121228/8730_1 /TAXON_ID=197538 /ORGANISM="Strombidium inclinatum, Strain S3" /LENGTH=56 /DNA_ID=CAMNT_0010765989 /DNA_START=51 /DNA_END=221 /DNA_ORIENTATION=-
MIDPGNEINKKAASQSENYELAVKNCLVLRQKLTDCSEEKDDYEKKIAILQEELRL